MDREAWLAAIHGVSKSRTRLSDWTELIRGLTVVPPPYPPAHLMPALKCSKTILLKEGRKRQKVIFQREKENLSCAIAHRHAALPAHCGAGVCSRDLLSRCLVGGQIQYEGLRHLCARLSAPPSSRAPSVSGFDCFQLPSVFLERGSSVPVKKGGRLIDHWLSWF